MGLCQVVPVASKGWPETSCYLSSHSVNQAKKRLNMCMQKRIWIIQKLWIGIDICSIWTGSPCLFSSSTPRGQLLTEEEGGFNVAKETTCWFYQRYAIGFGIFYQLLEKTVRNLFLEQTYGQEVTKNGYRHVWLHYETLICRHHLNIWFFAAWASHLTHTGAKMCVCLCVWMDKLRSYRTLRIQ